ncbi:unnamed protein product [Linum trigynum]|uniref:Zinc finger BED domain-containing protein RICESLEEPER 2-like n=1 Tax=Linum trigynum TaxID=586398 RepID=A0AAV2EAU5_9ROSI
MQSLLIDQLKEDDGLVCDGNYFHVRCGAHILNLIVHEGLKQIRASIDVIREWVKYVKGSESRMIVFEYCAKRSNCLNSKGLWLDCPTRWNSTYMMLERAELYRRAFQHLKLVDRNFERFSSDVEWEKIKKIKKILKPFDDITNLFSGVHYPTSNLYFCNVWRIQMRLMEASRSMDSDIRNMASAMKEKFDKYWESYSTILSMAVVFDPRYKLDSVKFCYEKLYGDINVAKSKCSELQGNICDLLKVYGDPGDQSPSFAENIDEDVDYGDDMEEFDSFGENQFLGDRTQLDEYLDDKRLKRKQPLDVLVWWKNNESQFPELAHLARDILSIPITTVASESAFSMGGRVLSSWQSSLLPENAEALITTRNWLYGFPSGDHDNGLEVKISKTFGASSVASDCTPLSDE